VYNSAPSRFSRRGMLGIFKKNRFDRLYNEAVDKISQLDYKGAAQLLTTAISVNAASSQVHFQRGLCYLNLNQYNEAVNDFTRTIEIDPKFPEAYINRATSNLELKQLDNAIADYSKAIEIKPDQADAYYNRGNTLLMKQELDRAIEDFSTAINLDPRFASAYNNRASAYKAKGKLDKAIADFKRSTEIDTGYLTAHQNLASLFYLNKNYKGTIDSVVKAIKLCGDDPKLLYISSRAKQNLSDYEGALNDVNKAKDITPSNNDYLLTRGILLYQQWKKDGADVNSEVIKQSREELLKLENYPDALYYLSLGYSNIDTSVALGFMSKAVEVAGKDIKYLVRRSTFYRRKGEIARALEDINNAIALEPKNHLLYVKRGVIQEKARNYPSAIKDFNFALELKPDSALPLISLGITRINQQEPDKALAHFDDAYKLEPNNPKMHFYKARVHIEKNELDLANLELNRCIELDPSFHKAFYYQGRVKKMLSGGVPVKQRKPVLKSAVDRFSNCLRIKPSYYPALMSRADTYHVLDEIEDALRNYAKAHRTRPHRTKPLEMIASINATRGNIKEALENIDKAIAINPSDDSLIQKREEITRQAKGTEGSKFQEQTGLLVEEINKISQSISKSPQNHKLYIERGILHEKAEMFNAAIDDFKRASEINNDDPSPFMSMGITRTKLNQLKQAVDDFTWAVKLNPNDQKVFYLRGKVYFKQKDWLSAIADFTRVIQIDPNNYMAYTERAKVLLRMAKEANPGERRHFYEHAKQDISKALELKPDYYASLLAAARLCSETGDLKMALQFYKRAQESEPKYPMPLLKIARIYRRLGNLPEAVDCMSRANSSSPNNSVITRELAKIYNATGDTKKGVALLSSAIESNPDDPLLYKARAILLRVKDKKKAIEDISRAIELADNNVSLYKIRAELYKEQGRHDEEKQDLRQIDELTSKTSRTPVSIAALKQILSSTTILDRQAAGFVNDIEPQVDTQGSATRMLIGLTGKKTDEIENVEEFYQPDADIADIISKSIKGKTEGASGQGVNPLLVSAFNLCQSKKFDEAITDLNDLLQQNPDDVNALILRGYSFFKLWSNKCYQDKELYQKCIDDYTHAEQFEKRPALYNAMALAKYCNNELAKALKDISRGIADPPDVNILYNRALIYLARDEYGKAMDDLSNAMTESPDSPKLHSLLGWQRSKEPSGSHYYRAAFEKLDDALNLDPSYAEGYKRRGAVRRELDDYSGALRDFVRAAKINPDIPKIHNLIGTCLLLTKKYKEADSFFTNALSSSVNDVDSLVKKGIARFALKDYLEAITSWSAACKIDSTVQEQLSSWIEKAREKVPSRA